MVYFWVMIRFSQGVGSMKQIVTALILFAFLFGCSNDNKITINNLASGNIYINFMAKKYTITPSATVTVTDIPNGTYTYATTYEIPYYAKTWSIESNAASGNLIFEKKDTQILMLYASTISTDSTYEVNMSVTSTRSTSSSPTSP
jgi:hypothetical protein